MKANAAFALLLAGVLTSPAAPNDEAWVQFSHSSGSFPLVSNRNAAALVFDASDATVVGIAVRDLALDVQRVTGIKPVVRTNSTSLKGSAVFVGTLGKSALIDQLASEGKIDAQTLRGQWESFLITTVTNPLPGVEHGLVIAGSDRRGTAYGVYELSQAIGVSPWYWWADVTPTPREALFVKAGTRRFGPPSVKYRGIFLNDEDWGLQPWAAKTFEPETGDIGPKTYAKIFELLLRLKANTLWPAMHECMKPFNHYPDNKRVADDYAIVMGSSHAEPMLRNNVGEWTAPPQAFNYATNREGVLKYWEERVASNGRFENIYTLGMRGIHDSAMQGVRGRANQIKTLEQIFADQRELLQKHVSTNVEEVPQMFCAYKEVLDLYRGGLKVPDDVTIVFPDDNFGYIRNFPNAEERKRKGGFGVYYHLSYLGRPLSYLWLYTTPPALVWEEMSKAYDHGARTIWIANIGDLKPAEIGTEFFLEMAWDINRWRLETLPEFLPHWARRHFGEHHAGAIAAMLDEYFRLNYQRKPEHLQWWLPNEQPRLSPLTDTEVDERLARFRKLASEANRISAELPEQLQDAFFELVSYPVRGSALANIRYFMGERGSAAAFAADTLLKEETRRYNEEIAGGKWQHFMSLEPADRQWRSMRIAPWEPPPVLRPAPPSEDAAHPFRSTDNDSGSNPEFVERDGVVSIEAENFSSRRDRGGAGWRVIPGLGRTGDSVAVFPTTIASVPLARVANASPALEYTIHFTSTGEFPVTVYLIPTQPIRGSGGLRFALALDNAPPQLFETTARDGSPAWAQSVLNATVTAEGRLIVPAPGTRRLKLYMVDTGVVLDKIVIDCGGLKPSYLGPAETRAAR